MLPSINAPDYLSYARVAVEEGIKVVETAGNPDPVLPFLKANNVIVIHKINMGTRWMCTMESPIHHSVKEEIVRMDENSTILVLRKFRNSTRLAKNEISLEVAKIENSKLSPKFDEVAHLMSGIRGRKVYETGDINAGVWTVGQATGLIKDIPTCVELAKRIEREATEALSRANARFSSDSHL
ncbi:hypothetical protein PoHVEF18_007865 [Penicillium ochrochloron]